MQSKLSVSPETLWHHLKNTSTFQLAATPLMRFKCESEEGFPQEWGEEAYRLRMYLFGVIPLGEHTISFIKIDNINRVLSTDESGKIIRTWQHTMCVQVEKETGFTVFQDNLYFKNGLLTFPTYVGVYLFFMYRHSRIKLLIKKGLIAECEKI